MNRYSRSHPLLFRVAAWLFVASLFCDSANLDDLISGCTVLHEDAEAIVSSKDASDLSWTSLPTGQHISPEAASFRHLTELPRISHWIILDQDSPSLASDANHSLIKLLNLFINSGQVSSIPNRPTELLHLKYHSLLI